MEANLLITYEPTHKGSSEEEVKALLGKVGKNVQLTASPVEGVFLAKVDKPKAAVKELRKLCEKDPDRFAYTNRWVPVDKWVKADIKEMTKTIGELGAKIDQDEKWKLDLSKRQFDAPKDIIIKLTDLVDRPNVDLKNPDKIIQVEILGKKAAISLLNKDEVLNKASAGR